jgi:aspartate kinase
MGNDIVCKFGGTSLSSAEQIEKVRRIVADDRRRNYVVVSAPGRQDPNETKITDHLHNIATEGTQCKEDGISAEESARFVQERFSSIIKELGIEGEDILGDLADDLRINMSGERKVDYLASRGEHYNAKIISRYFTSKGMKAEEQLPEEIGFMTTNEFGNASILPETYGNIRDIEENDIISVIPGYYGITRDDDIAVLSRGGSDLTAGEVAYAIDAVLYENWTDTDGIYQVDPRLIPGAGIIPILTYKEIRLLSSQGFNIFHYDAMMNCRRKNIPIRIKNTNNPKAEGTMIEDERVPNEAVVGIGRLDNMAYVYIEKFMMGEEIGFTRDLLQIFKEYDINTYHYPTDRDDIAIILDQDDLMGKTSYLKEEIEKVLKPDTVDIKYNLSVISPVGLGMKDHPGILARAASAFRDRNINIDIVVQGPAQISFHFGIHGYFGDDGLKALYEDLIKNPDI